MATTVSGKLRKASRIATLVAVPAVLVVSASTSGNAFTKEGHQKGMSSAFSSSNCKDVSCPEGETLADFKRAVMTPDAMEFEKLEAHCDGGDYLDPQDNGGKHYPVKREKADEYFYKCIDRVVRKFDEAVDAAGKLVVKNREGVYVTDPEQGLDYGTKQCVGKDNKPVSGNENRAKCKVINALGAEMHAVEDFYAHSNWSDKADPNKKIGVENPPGLEKGTELPGFLDVYQVSKEVGNGKRVEDVSKLPEKLSTGCWVYSGKDDPHKCDGRISERKTMQKDTAGDSRSKIDNGKNFANVLTAAGDDVFRQWKGFDKAVHDRYGKDKGDAIMKAVAKD